MLSFQKTKIFLLFSIFLLTSCQTVTEIEISGKVTEPFTKQSRENSLLLKCTEFNSHYLHITVKPDLGKDDRYSIYVGKTEEASEQFSDNLLMESGTNKNHIYIPRNLFTTTDEANIYVRIYSEDIIETSNYKVEFEYENEIELKVGVDYSLISFDGNQRNVYRFPRSEHDKDYFLNFYAIGGHDDDIIDLDLQLLGPLVDHETITHHRHENLFYGGDLMVIDQKALEALDPPVQFHEGQFYALTLESKENVLIRVGVEYANTEEDGEQLHMNTTINGFVDSSIARTKCFRIDNDDKSNQTHVMVQSRNGINVYFTDKINGEIVDITQSHNVEGSDTIITSKLTVDTLGFICFGPLQGKTFGDFQVKLINADYLNVAYPILDPLYNGVVHSMRLKPGEVQMYLYSKFRAYEDKEINYNVRSINGRLAAYIVPTDVYPHMSFRPDQGEGSTAQELLDINGFFQYHGSHKNEGNAWSRNKNLLVVECPSLNKVVCSFEVSFFDEDDDLLIKPNNRYLQTMLPNEEDHFLFTITDTSIKYVLVELTTLTGDSNMEVFKQAPAPDDVTSYFIGNKEVVSIVRSDNEDDLLGTYQIVISSATSNVYTISYYLYKETDTELSVDVDGGLQVIEYLKVSETKIITMQNRYNQLGYTYISTFTPINCKMDISFGGTEKLTFEDDHFFQHEIRSNHPSYSLHEYKYSLTATAMDHGNDYQYENELCIVLIASSSVEVDAEIVISEATPITIKLDDELKYANFLFPRPPGTGNVIVHVNTEADTLLHLEYRTELGTETYVFSRSRQIVISEEKLLNLCKPDNVCPLSFYLAAKDELKDVLEGVQVDFAVRTRKSKVPSYLKKGKLRDDYVYNDSIQYFVCDIGPNESGEITLNFNRGSGYLLAKLLRKELTEDDADWNSKVKLPVPSDSNLIDSYNSLTGKLTYDASYTSICEKGCDMYIGVVADEQYIDPHIDEFTIYVKSFTTEDKPIDVPVNEFVHGAIVDTNKMDYYTFNLPMHSTKVSIEFHSDMCGVYINKGSTKPTEQQYDNYHFSEATSILFEAELDDDTKYDRYTLGVKCKSITHVQYSPYNFRVRIVQQGDIELVEVDSNHEVLCQTKSPNSYCDFIISNDAFDNITEIALHAWASVQTDLTFYALNINQEEFDGLSNDGKKAKLPRQGGTDVVSSATQFIKDYLYFPIENENTYILVSVHSSEPSIITFLHSYRTGIEVIHVHDFTARLIQLESQQSLNFIVPNQFETYVTISSVDGYGVFEHGNEYSLSLKGNRTRIHYNQQRYISPYAKITNKGVDPYIFYIWYQASSAFENVNEVRYGMIGKSLCAGAYIPIINYARYYKQEAISVSYKITNLKHDMTPNSPDDFTISGYVVDLDFISKLKRNATMRPETDNIIQGFFDYPTRTGYLEFDVDDTTIDPAHQKYIMMVLNREDSNFNGYTDLIYDISILPHSDTTVPAQPEMYHYNEIKQSQVGGNVHYLIKKSSSNTKMLFEFSANNRHINFAISDVPFQSGETTYTNKTSLIPSTVKTIGGKVSFIINISSINAVYLAVFNNADREFDFKANKYSYRYVLDPPEDNYEIPEKVSIIKPSESERQDQVTVVFDAIKDSNGQKVEATYHIKLYAKVDLEENEEIDKVTPTPTKADFIRKIEFQNIKDKNEELFTDLNVGTYNITVVAEITKTGELIAYGKESYELADIFLELPFDTLNSVRRSEFTDHVHGYFKLPDNVNKNLLVMKLRDFDYTTEVPGNLDRFEIVAYYVNEVFIGYKKENPSITPTTDKFAAIHYTQENFYYVQMKQPDGASTENRYIYFEISRHKNNKNYYKNYVMELAAYDPDMKPEFSYSPGQFYMGKLTYTNKAGYYRITRTEEKYYYAIECAPHYMNSTFEFTVEEYNDTSILPVGTNTTDIIKDVKYLNGKIIIVVLSYANDIVVSFKSSVNLDDNYGVIEYFFKYTVHEDYPSDDYSKFSLGVSHIQVSNLATFTVKNIMIEEKSIDKVHYTFKIYKTARIVNNHHLVSSLFNPSDEDTNYLRPDVSNSFTLNTNQDPFVSTFPLPEVDIDYMVFISAHAEISSTKEEIKVGFNPTNFVALSTNIEPFGDFFTISSSSPQKYRFVDPPDDYPIDSILMKVANNGEHPELICKAGFVNFEYVTNKILDKGDLPEVYLELINYHPYDKGGYLILERRESNLNHYVYIDCSESPDVEFEASFVVYSYNNKVPSFIISQNEYYVDGLSSNEYKKIYTLRKRSSSDNIYEIEYAEESNKSYFNITVEPLIAGKEPTFETNPDIILLEDNIEGKKRLVVQPAYEDRDKPLLLCFSQNAPIGGSHAAFEFKYRTITNMGDIHDYTYNRNITANQKDNTIEFNVENANYQKQENTTYYYRVYNNLLGVTEDEIATTYISIEKELLPSEPHPIASGVSTVGSSSELVKFSCTLKDPSLYYISIVAIYVDTNTNEQQKLGYRLYHISTYDVMVNLMEYNSRKAFFQPNYKGESLAIYAKLKDTTFNTNVHIQLTDIEYTRKDLDDIFEVYGYTVNQKFIDNRLNGIQIEPPSEGVQGFNYEMEKNIVVDVPAPTVSENVYVFIELKTKSALDSINFYRKITFDTSLYQYNKVLLLDEYEHFVNTLNQDKTSVTYLLKPEHQYVYVEFGDKENTRMLKFAVEKEKDTPTFKNEITSKSSIVNGKIIVTFQITGNCLFSLINDNNNNIEYFIKFKSASSENDIITYSNYTRKVEYQLSVAESTVSLKFANLLYLQNNIPSLQYSIEFYPTMMVSNPIILESLFNYKYEKPLHLEPLITDTFEMKNRYSKIETREIEISLNLKYYVVIKAFYPNKESHRFGFDFFTLDTTEPFFPKVILNQRNPYCFREDLNDFSFYLDVTKIDNLPYFSIKYSNITITDKRKTNDKFTLNGYNVNLIFIEERKKSVDIIPSGNDFIYKSKTITSGNSLYAYPDNKKINNYVYMNIRKSEDNENIYSNICFDVIPYEKTSNSVIPIEEKQYIYNEIGRDETISFPIELPEGKNLYYIELIQGFNFNRDLYIFAEVNKGNPQYSDEVKIQIKNEEGKRTAVIEMTNNLYIHVTRNDSYSLTSNLRATSENENFLFKYATYAKKEDIPKYGPFAEVEQDISFGVLKLKFENLLYKYNTSFTEGSYTVKLYNQDDKNFNEQYASSILYDKVVDKIPLLQIETNAANINGEFVNAEIKLNNKAKDSNLYVSIIFDLTNKEMENTKIAFPGVKAKKQSSLLILWIVLAIAVVIGIGVFVFIKVKKSKKFNKVKLPSGEMKLVDDDITAIN